MKVRVYEDGEGTMRANKYKQLLPGTNYEISHKIFWMIVFIAAFGLP